MKSRSKWGAAYRVALYLLVASMPGVASAQYSYGFPGGEVTFTPFAIRDSPLWEPFANVANDPLLGPVGSAVGMIVADIYSPDTQATQRKTSLCTATLIAHNRAITNAHCFADPRFRVVNAWLRMDFLDGRSQFTDITINPVPLDIDYKLDYAVISVLDQHNYSPVRLAYASASMGESLFMIHHSSGEYKRISRVGCTLINRPHEGQKVVSPPRLELRPLDPSTDRFHFCDSQPGSSGSLMFAVRDGQPTIVGLHFAGTVQESAANRTPESQRFNLFVDFNAIVRNSMTLRAILETEQDQRGEPEGPEEPEEPQEQYANVTFVSQPAGATLKYGDRSFGTTPVTLRVGMGRFNFTLELAGYETQQFVVDVADSQARTITKELSAARAAPSPEPEPAPEPDPVADPEPGRSCWDELTPSEINGFGRECLEREGVLTLGPGRFHWLPPRSVSGDVDIRGAGIGETVLVVAGGGSRLYFNGGGELNIEALTMEANERTFSGSMVEVTGGDVWITGVRFVGHGDGSALSADGDAGDIWLWESQFDSWRTAVDVKAANSLDITDSEFRNNRHGLRVWRSVNGMVMDSQYSNNSEYAVSCQDDGFAIDSTVSFSRNGTDVHGRCSWF